MKIGLFFGSFNPIHHGHLMVAQAVLNQTDCQEIWFVVSPHNPHKKSTSLLHEFDRIDLVEAAIEDQFQFRSCDIEFNLPKPSYTIDTLAHLSERFPKHQFELIMGGDNLESFKSWKNFDKILDYFGLIVYPRGDKQSSDLWTHPKVKTINAPHVHLSATYIRDCIKKGHSIKYLLPDTVISIINQKKFYL